MWVLFLMAGIVILVFGLMSGLLPIILVGSFVAAYSLVRMNRYYE